MTDVLQQKKEEVANVYLKDLKEELGFLKWSIVGMFKKKLKSMMTSDEELGDSFDTSKLNFWEKMLVNISPSTAEKVFAFIKEKQEKIQKAKTEEELDALKAWIVVTATTTPTSETTPTTGETATTPEETTPETEPTTTTEETGTQEETVTDTEEEKKKKEEEEKEKLEEEEKTNEAEEKEEKKENKKENVTASVAVGWWLWMSVLALDKINTLKTKNKIAKNIDLKTPEAFAEKMKTQFTKLSKQLDQEVKLNPKLSSFQSKALSKSAREFEKVAAGMDGETIKAVNMLQELDKKLPASMLKSVDPKEADLFIRLGTEDLDEIIAINKMTDLDDAAKITKIDEILKAKGIKNIKKEVITALKSADDVAELKSMVTVLTKAKWVSGFMKWIKGIAFLDLISTGFDVRVLYEWLDEAEAYRKLNAVRSDTKREHQWVQFGASVAITALWIIATCAAVGSVVPGLGTIVGLAVGVAGFAISQAIDIYYDKVEFYLQNEEDFKLQYRTEIKQAIVQSVGAEELKMNEQERAHAIIEKWGALTTVKDARRALIRQEEYKKSEYIMIQQLQVSDKTEAEFLETLTAEEKTEYTKQKTALNAVIEKRLEYVKKFMYEKDNKSQWYLSLVSSIKSSLGIKKIEKILADSKVYYEMGQTWDDQYVTGCTTIEDYKTKYGEKLKADDATKFELFEKMRTDDQYKFLEIYYGVDNFEWILESQKNQEDADLTKIEAMQKNVDFIQRFYTYKMMGVPIEDQKKMELSIRMIDNKNIENMLTTGDFEVANNYSADSVEWYFTNHGILDRLESKAEVSDKVGQNIIYRIAKEIHGYTGNNDMDELIEYFSMGKENSTGLYYDDQWIINNDRAIDKGIDISTFDKMTAKEICKERVRPNNRNAVFEITIDPSPLKLVGLSTFGFMDEASMIDTPTEGMDDKLNMEYRTKVKTIIYEEKSYSDAATKKTIEQAIVDYITTNSVDGGYIELPYYLIIAAKKAKIGNLEKYLFTYQDNKITACTTKLYIHNELDFSQTWTDIEKEYIAWVKEGLSENTQKYIDYVDKVKDEFVKLITHGNNDLDIPKENMEIYQAKITERETLKESLNTLDAATAKTELETKYKEYHDYFENTYIGMLKLISTFKTNIFSSNDLDSATYHQQVEWYAAEMSKITISDEGVITWPTDNLSDMQKDMFDTAVLTQKIDGKTITELAKSKEITDQNKAIRAVRQILKSIYEAQILRFDTDGVIANIGYGERKDKLNKAIYQKNLENNLKVNLTNAKYFDASQYEIEEEQQNESEVEIKDLTKEQEEMVETIPEVVKIIKETNPDKTCPDRGVVLYDVETGMLTSRSKKIKLDTKALKIEGLDIAFNNLKELALAADLMNMLKYKYPWTKDFYRGRIDFGLAKHYFGIYKPTPMTIDNLYDTRVLTIDKIKRDFPTWLDSNNDVKSEVITYINSIT